MTRRVLLLLLFAAPAFAHHMEEVGSYLHVTLSPAGASVEYTAAVSRGVAAAQLAQIDTDGNGRINAEEGRAYADAMGPSLAQYLTLELADHTAPFHVLSATLSAPADATAAGRFLLRVQLAAEWPTRPVGRCRGSFRNENFRGYFGNSAIWLHAAPGVEILSVEKKSLDPLPGGSWRLLFLAPTLPLDERLAEFTAVFGHD